MQVAKECATLTLQLQSEFTTANAMHTMAASAMENIRTQEATLHARATATLESNLASSEACIHAWKSACTMSEQQARDAQVCTNNCN